MIYPSFLFDNVASDLATQYVRVPPFDVTPTSSSLSAIKYPSTRTLGNPSQPGYGRSGMYLSGVNDTLYNRIIFSTDAFDFGSLTAVQTRYFSVWNSYRADKAVTELVGSGTDGMTLVQPMVAPFTLSPYQEITYQLSIGLEGPPAVDGVYQWTIDGKTYQVTIRGRRVMLIDLVPNWSSPLVESLEWQTAILRAYSGKEQRRQLRNTARRSFEFNFLAAGVKAQQLDNLLWGWQNRAFALPVWTDRSTLSSITMNGAQVIPVDTTTRCFADVGLIMIRNGDDYEMAEIASFTDSNVTISSGLQSTWPAGSAVYPVGIGYLNAQLQITRHTDSVVNGSITFDGKPGEFGPYTPAATAPVTYNGYEVIAARPNWKSGLQFTPSFASRSFDSVTGARQQDVSEEYARVTRQYTWTLRSRAEILAFRQQLARLAGMRHPCYVPTWNSDFTLTRDHASTESGLTYVPNGFKNMVGVDPTRCVIMVYLPNGTRVFRTIHSVSTDQDGNEAIGLDSTLGVNVPKGSLITVLLLSRLATDRIQIEWHTTSVATVNTSFISVPD